MIGLREEFSGIHIQPSYKNYHLPQFNLTEKLGDGCEIIIPDFIISKKLKEIMMLQTLPMMKKRCYVQ